MNGSNILRARLIKFPFLFGERILKTRIKSKPRSWIIGANNRWSELARRRKISFERDINEILERISRTYRPRFTNRILSGKCSNNPASRCNSARRIMQDPSRYACARILGTWFQRSRHFPLILSIVPAVRNSGFWKRSRVLFPRRRPRLHAHNRANFSSPGTSRNPKDGSPKIGRKCDQYFRQLRSPARKTISYTELMCDSLRSSSQRKDGSYALCERYSRSTWIFNFFSWIDRSRSNYLRDEVNDDLAG